MEISRFTLAVLAGTILLTTCAFAQGGKYSPQALKPGAPSRNVSNPVTSAASTAPDVFEVQYFRNANTSGVPDQEIDIVDPGTNWTSAAAAAPNLCADIYVVTPDEELNECCGCPVTPDQLISGTVNAFLTTNPANGRTASNGVIKIISSVPDSYGNCNPATPIPTPTLRAWITHVNNILGTTNNPVFTTTEEEFARPDLGAGEKYFLSKTCGDFIRDLSGAGICTCPDPGICPAGASCPGR